MSEHNTFYITTPIYYPSDKLHIGHSYTTVACDALARFKRMQGKEVMFLTGTDEHGQKIQDKAADAGVTPKEYVDRIVATVKDLWKLLDVSYDRFIRTTDDYHVETCQKIFTQLYEQGDIYKGEYIGHYCKPCESFWTDSQPWPKTRLGSGRSRAISMAGHRMVWKRRISLPTMCRSAGQNLS